MEELYVEGVATHGGPESCVVVCEGGVEGNVNRIKTIKRQMYGRAKFDLLRKRVLLGN